MAFIEKMNFMKVSIANQVILKITLITNDIGPKNKIILSFKLPRDSGGKIWTTMVHYFFGGQTDIDNNILWD